MNPNDSLDVQYRKNSVNEDSNKRKLESLSGKAVDIMEAGKRDSRTGGFGGVGQSLRDLDK